MSKKIESYDQLNLESYDKLYEENTEVFRVSDFYEKKINLKLVMNFYANSQTVNRKLKEANGKPLRYPISSDESIAIILNQKTTKDHLTFNKAMALMTSIIVDQTKETKLFKNVIDPEGSKKDLKTLINKLAEKIGLKRELNEELYLLYTPGFENLVDVHTNQVLALSLFRARDPEKCNINMLKMNVKSKEELMRNVASRLLANIRNKGNVEIDIDEIKDYLTMLDKISKNVKSMGGIGDLLKALKEKGMDLDLDVESDGSLSNVLK